MADFFQLTPNGLYEQNPAKGGICSIIDVVFSAAAATNNQQIIAGIPAVAGVSPAKAIMVISGNIRNVGAANQAITFKSGNAGTNLRAYEIPSNAVVNPNVYLPFDMAGHFRTASGIGLFVDNPGAAIITISLTYITYAT